MRRKLTTLRAKQGHSENGAPKQMLDEARLRERQNNAHVHANNGTSPHFDSEYSGWSHAARPRDQSVSLRAVTALLD